MTAKLTNGEAKALRALVNHNGDDLRTEQHRAPGVRQATMRNLAVKGFLTNHTPRLTRVGAAAALAMIGPDELADKVEAAYEGLRHRERYTIDDIAGHHGLSRRDAGTVLLTLLERPDVVESGAGIKRLGR